ncbi:MAG: hypothetical protein Q8O67_32575 [Deltaproteobacteria bacterium]|nr:hypothetical protein [Deltaproteobacteria bacterium]
MFLAIAALIVVGTPPELPLASFMRVPPKAEPLPTRWGWPTDDEFARTWERRAGVRSVRLIEGELSSVDYDDKKLSGPVLVGVTATEVFIADDARPGRGGSYLPDEWSARLLKAEVGAILTDTYEGKETLRLKVTRVVAAAAVDDVAWVPFTFAATLLRHDGELYDAPVDRSRGEHPATARASLETAVTDEEKLQAYRHYRPMGRCSMDTRPRDVAAEYRDHCKKMGRIGCFLQLQARLMADQFESVAWSSYGEAIMGTDAPALVEAGVDVPRFLVGLGLVLGDADLRPGGINTWRLARTIHESGRRDELRAGVLALVEDERLDELNRVRFGQVIALLDGRLAIGAKDDGPAESYGALRGKKLPPWLKARING